MIRASALLLAASLAGCTTPEHELLHDQPRAMNVPGGCSDPAGGRNDKLGCYLTAIQQVGKVDGPLYWHIYSYADRFQADAMAKAAGKRGRVVEAFETIWLYALAEKGWHPAAGARVAVIGPLATKPGVFYTARYMEATFVPGMKTGAHVHSGAEAWYMVSGAQCLQTPERTFVVRAGESAVVPEGPPMVLSSVGTETRRSILVVLHDGHRGWSAPEPGWVPREECPELGPERSRSYPSTGEE
jgi:quercetin dioxygenase-like cupin family protein